MALAAILVVLATMAGVADAATTVTIDVTTSDPAEQAPFALTSSGTTDLSRQLSVFVESGASDSSVCAATAYDQYQRYSSTEVSGSAHGADGDAVGPGNYSKTYGYTPTAAGKYLVCAYVQRENYTTPYATQRQIVNVRRATASVATTVTTEDVVEQGVFELSATGVSERSRQLLVFVESGVSDSSVCAATAYDQYQRYSSTEVSGSAYGADGDAVGPGSYSKTYSYTPTAAGKYLVCTYVQRENYTTPYASGLARFEGSGGSTTAPATGVNSDDSAATAALVGPVHDEHVGVRPVFRWRDGPGSDTLLLFTRDPASGARPVAQIAQGAATLSTPQIWSATRETMLTPGTYWWAVARTVGGKRVVSAAVRFVVDPPPLRALRVMRRISPGKLVRAPGFTRLIIRVAPFTGVLLTVRRVARACASATTCAQTRNIAMGASYKRSVKFKWDCGAPGRYRYTVVASDAYGTSQTSRGSWELSHGRCEQLRRRAARRRAAKRRAEERRRQESQRDAPAPRPPSSGGGGGGGSSYGCDGDPGATPFPQFPGQRDGDGDGCYGES
jgi:hypothetical protein